MENIANLSDEVARDMLEAEARVVIREQKSRAPRNTGALAGSIKASKMKRDRNGARCMYVYPQGLHHTYIQRGTGRTIKVRNAEVGFIHEYGAPQRGIRAQGWVSASNAAAENEAVEEAGKVYDNFIKKF